MRSESRLASARPTRRSAAANNLQQPLIDAAAKPDFAIDHHNRNAIVVLHQQVRALVNIDNLRGEAMPFQHLLRLIAQAATLSRIEQTDMPGLVTTGVTRRTLIVGSGRWRVQAVCRTGLKPVRGRIKSYPGCRRSPPIRAARSVASIRQVSNSLPPGSG